MKFLKIFVWIILILVIAYLLGPRPSAPIFTNSASSSKLETLTVKGPELEKMVATTEATHHLKANNEARIIWQNDSLKNQTDYSIVYLHGFGASQEEGEPVHRNIAEKFGCNLYLSRLADHGIDTPEAFINFTADKYWESARNALEIGEALGKKVILVATSTGGSLALQLAATYPDKVHALILMSPNVSIFDPNAWLLNNPWGLQIARMILGSNYVDATDERPIYRSYWYYHYRIEGVVQLQEYLETTMTKKTFEKIHQPTLMLYYYKDEVHQDSTVRVDAMLKMFSQLGTPSNLKRSVSMPKAGNHVIGSYIKSNDVEGVERETEKFMIEVLGMKPVLNLQQARL
jgi:pimeloyl-ACP methyl ester carboxylesterase